MSTGRPARTSRTQILDAARQLLQQQGAAALSIRNVAAAVDTAPSTIYNYFGSKQGLLAALANEMLHESRPAITLKEDPVTALREWMFQYRRHLRQTPELIALAHRSDPVPPAVLDIINDLVTLLQRAGLPPAEAVVHGAGLLLTVHGFVIQEQSAELLGLPHKLPDYAAPENIALAKRLAKHDHDQVYASTVERNLAGLFGKRG